MKPTTQFSKKLVLNKETLHVLTNQEMALVAGAGLGTNTCNTCLVGYPCGTNGTSKDLNCTSGQYSICGQISCVRCVTATTG